MNRENTLKKLHATFLSETNIRCKPVDRGVAYVGWFELLFESLDCEEMEDITRFLRKHFSQPNLFSHRLPKIVSCREGVSLLFQDKEVFRVFNK